MISISKYDPEVDAIYFKLKDNTVLESQEITKGIVADYDDDNNIVGIELVGLKNITLEALNRLESSISSGDMEVILDHLL